MKLVTSKKSQLFRGRTEHIGNRKETENQISKLENQFRILVLTGFSPFTSWTTEEIRKGSALTPLAKKKSLPNAALQITRLLCLAAHLSRSCPREPPRGWMLSPPRSFAPGGNRAVHRREIRRECRRNRSRSGHPLDVVLRQGHFCYSNSYPFKDFKHLSFKNGSTTDENKLDWILWKTCR
jgi:hypothetical protein